MLDSGAEGSGDGGHVGSDGADGTSDGAGADEVAATSPSDGRGDGAGGNGTVAAALADGNGVGAGVDGAVAAVIGGGVMGGNGDGDDGAGVGAGGDDGEASRGPTPGSGRAAAAGCADGRVTRSSGTSSMLGICSISSEGGAVATSLAEMRDAVDRLPSAGKGGGCAKAASWATPTVCLVGASSRISTRAVGSVMSRPGLVAADRGRRAAASSSAKTGTSSPALLGRSAGALARRRATRTSRAGATFSATVESAGAGVLTCPVNTSNCDSPRNGTYPAIMRKTMQPSA